MCAKSVVCILFVVFGTATAYSKEYCCQGLTVDDRGKRVRGLKICSSEKDSKDYVKSKALENCEESEGYPFQIAQPGTEEYNLKCKNNMYCK